MKNTVYNMNAMEPEFQRAVSDFVNREVHYCASVLVSDLARLEPDDEQLLDLLQWYDSETDDYVEILEHWIVSDWLADRLADYGEIVDKDFHGLTIWGRATSGQSISLDECIISIFRDLQRG